MHNTHSTIKSVYYVDIIGHTEYTVHIIVIQIRNISQVFIQGFGDAITISVKIESGKNKQEQMTNAKIVARKLINVFSAIVSVLIVSIAIIIANISFK